MRRMSGVVGHLFLVVVLAKNFTGYYSIEFHVATGGNCIL